MVIRVRTYRDLFRMVIDVVEEALRVRRALVKGLLRRDGTRASVRPNYVEQSAESFRSVYGPGFARLYLLVVGPRRESVYTPKES